MALERAPNAEVEPEAADEALFGSERWLFYLSHFRFSANVRKVAHPVGLSEVELIWREFVRHIQPNESSGCFVPHADAGADEELWSLSSARRARLDGSSSMAISIAAAASA